MAKSSSSLPKAIGALRARTQFGEIIRRASGRNRERFLVGLRGEPKVVIMGVEDYLSTIAPEPEILAKIRANSVKNGTSHFSVAEIDREIAAARRERTRTNAKANRRS